MRRLFAVVTFLAPAASIAAFAQEPKLAPEGRGLIPKVEMLAKLGGTPPPHPFVREPSGGFSRTIFETDEDPNFTLIIRDFSFPPDKQSHLVPFPSGAFVHLLSGLGEVRIAEQRMALSARSRTAVPAGATIEVVNSGEYPVVVRALIADGN